MQHAPTRGWDPELAQEPHVYRMLEVSAVGALLRVNFESRPGAGAGRTVVACWPTDGLHRLATSSPQAVHHYGEALKAIINEKFGDGIMSGAACLPFSGPLLLVDGQCSVGCTGWCSFGHIECTLLLASGLARLADRLTLCRNLIPDNA